MAYKILRLPEVMNISGLSRSNIYLKINQGLWPKPINLGARAVGWPDYEVDQVLAARISGKSETEIKDLIQELIQARQSENSNVS